MITAETLVAREVHYCVSSLVSTLAQGYGCWNATQARDLSDMIEQAGELCLPLEDWEGAAKETGFTGPFETDAGTMFKLAEQYGGGVTFSENWQTLCEDQNIDPHEREVYEHWIVSDWLADKLAEKGEKVDKDFAGLTVWARTTTGQGIASDWVIEQIVADLNAA